MAEEMICVCVFVRLCVGLGPDQFDTPDRNSHFVCFMFQAFYFLWGKWVLDIDILMRNGRAWRRTRMHDGGI